MVEARTERRCDAVAEGGWQTALDHYYRVPSRDPRYQEALVGEAVSAEGERGAQGYCR